MPSEVALRIDLHTSPADFFLPSWRFEMDVENRTDFVVLVLFHIEVGFQIVKLLFVERNELLNRSMCVLDKFSY